MRHSSENGPSTDGAATSSGAVTRRLRIYFSLGMAGNGAVWKSRMIKWKWIMVEKAPVESAGSLT